jgi:hypothetical protein
MTSMTKHYAIRHPFVTGIAMLILGPYILAFLLFFAVLFVIAAALDALGGRR